MESQIVFGVGFVGKKVLVSRDCLSELRTGRRTLADTETLTRTHTLVLNEYQPEAVMDIYTSQPIGGGRYGCTAAYKAPEPSWHSARPTTLDTNHYNGEGRGVKR